MDEADRVGQQYGLATRQGETTGGRVERGEQTVLGQHAGVGQRVQQRRLPRVRVADDRHRRQPAAIALLALQAASLGERVQLLLQAADAALDAPPVDLELGLAATEAGADAAALLGQLGVAPRRSRGRR